MSARSRPASATARRHAVTVSDNGSTMRRRPIVELPTPVSATLSSNLRVDDMGRTSRLRSPGPGTGPASAASESGSNSGIQMSSCRSKITLTCRPIATCSGSQPTMFVVSRAEGLRRGRRPRRRRAAGGGQPLLMIHGKTGDRRASRYRRHRNLVTAAVRTDRTRRVVVPAARLALGNPEPAIGATRPERLGADARLRQGPHNRLGGAGLCHHTSGGNRRTTTTNRNRFRIHHPLFK